MMPPTRDPPVQRNLQATAELLDALKDDPSLLQDEEFIRRLAILRQKHEETTNFLAKRLGAPPLPTMTTSSITSTSKTQNHSYQMKTSTSCHQRFLNSEDVQEESEYHTVHRQNSEEYLHEERLEKPSHQETYQSPYEVRIATLPPKIRVPIRIAPMPPGTSQSQNSENPRIIHHHVITEPKDTRNYEKRTIPRLLENRERNSRSSSMPRHQQQTRIATSTTRQQNPQHDFQNKNPHHHHSTSSGKPRLQNSTLNFQNSNPRHQRTSSTTVRQILAKASSKHLANPSPSVATSSVAMPSGLLLSSSNTKHVPSHPPQFATSSHVVEESFLEDGMSTTREVPTIVDDLIVEKKHQKTRFMNGSISQNNRSKSMHNLVEPPQVTIPKPFQLSLRKSIGNTYAKKFMSDLMSEKQKREEDLKKSLENIKFKANPVPKSTYLPTNTFATEQKYVAAMRRKVAAVARKKFEAQNEMVRSKSEGNLSSIKPLGYVPPSTYISPIPVKPNARSRSATTRSAILIQEATTPKGIKSHRAQSNLTHQLRHGRCKLDTSAVVQHRRTSPPDFNKIHAKISEEYRRTNSKPSTVPMPFKFASRSQSATSRHTNCKEKEPEQFKPPSKTQNSPTTKSSQNTVPSTHATQLREELNRSRIQKEKAENSGKNNFWAEDNRKRIATFLGARSKTDEDIAIRTKQKMKQQHETTQEYMRQLTEMKQRVLNGPLIMEKQTALAQEHRLKRKFAERMKSSKMVVTKESRRNSETSAAGTFVVDKVSVQDVASSSSSSSESEESPHKSSGYSEFSEKPENEKQSSGGGTAAASESSTSSESSESSSESSDAEEGDSS